MPEYCAEFCLSVEQSVPAEGAELLDPRGRFRLALANAKRDEATLNTVVVAHLYYCAPSLETAEAKASEFIVEAANCIAFVINSKVHVSRPRKIVDWTDGLRRRQALYFTTEVAGHFQQQPPLDGELLKSAQELLHIDQSGPLSAALRWYRLGIGARNVDEQFSFFWFALEIVAECTKGNEKVPDQCVFCKGPLFCTHCQKTPVHRKFLKDEIRERIKNVNPRGSDEISETLFKIRNTLQHGRSLEDIESELPCTVIQAVNKLANITWNAILGLMKSQGKSTAKLAVQVPTTFVDVDISAALHLEIDTPDGKPNMITVVEATITGVQ